MKELFDEARCYGRVNLFTSDDGTYSVDIRFNTKGHVELKARSGYDHTSPEQALKAAIKEAKSIVDQSEDLVKRIKDNLGLVDTN